jgi:death-on-curing protein
VSVFLSVEDVISLHDQLDPSLIIDRGKLEGAVGRPQASFGGDFLHASIYKQASVMMHGICQAHAFQDGNKRTAWVATLTFLEQNGVTIVDLEPEYMSDYMVEVATHIHTEADTALWLASLDPRNNRTIN